MTCHGVDLVSAGSGGVKIAGAQQPQQVRSAGLPDIPNSIVCWKQDKRSICSVQIVWNRTDERRDGILRRGFQRVLWKPRCKNEEEHTTLAEYAFAKRRNTRFSPFTSTYLMSFN